MPRERNPNREKAHQIWIEHKGDITNRQIAEMLGENEKVIAVWKQRDRWNVVQQSDESCTTNGETVISWIDIETEYVTDIRKKPCSLNDLATKYRIPIDTIKKYAAANKWTEKRHKHSKSVAQKTAAKTAEIISDDIAKATVRHFLLSSKLLDVVEKAASDPKEFYRFVEKLRTGYAPGEFDEKIVTEVLGALNDAKLLNVVNALDKLQKMQRQTLGILEEKDKQRLDLDLYKQLPRESEEETADDGFIDALKSVGKGVWSNDTPSK